MPRKVFEIQVELEIQAITCPGVWLCPYGNISLQLYMLDCCIQTSSLPPVFPLLFHERYIFYKTFTKAQQLSDLQRLLCKEYMFAELIQWKNSEEGNVLCSFQTSLSELLYPSTHEGAIAGVYIDLLMEPSKKFPGIIAPKIEANTRTTIEETFCEHEQKCSAYVINPKVISSKHCEAKRHMGRQKKVCHSDDYHRSNRCAKPRSCKKPPFVVRKVEDDLILRKLNGAEARRTNCRCSSQAQSTGSLFNTSPGTSPTRKRYSVVTEEFLKKHPKTPNHKPKWARKTRYPKQVCHYHGAHARENCGVCSKYSCYFERSPREKHESRIYHTSSPKHPDSHYCAKVEKINPCCRCSRGIKENLFSSKLCNVNNRCDVHPVKDNENESEIKSFYTPQKKPSLAEKLHRRLTETLNTSALSPCSNYEAFKSDFECGTNSAVDRHSCNIRNCREEFYTNLEKFYKKLYQQGCKPRNIPKHVNVYNC